MYNIIAGSVKDWSSEMSGFMECQASVSNYNNHLELWEPMVEPFSTEIDYNVKNGVHEVNIKNGDIYLNISKSFIEAILLTLSSINESSDPKQQNQKEKLLKLEKSEQIQPFTIKNETGIPVIYTISGNDSRTYKLEIAEEKPLVFVTHQKRDCSWTQRAEAVNKTLSISLKDSLFHRYEKTDYGLPMDRVGKYKLNITNRIDPSKKNRALQLATFDVSSYKGDKIITIRSNILFTNKTTTKVSLLFEHRTAEKGQILELLPEKTIPAPIYFTEEGTVQFIHNDAV